MSRERTPVNFRKGIPVTDEMRRAYERRDKSRDEDPDHVLPTPDQMAQGMRREEWFRPVKKLFSFRIDAEVLEYFKQKGEGYQTAMNAALREKMNAERQQAK